MWRSLKYECVFLNAFETGSEARFGIGRWIGYYNADRPHSSFAGRTPDEIYAIELQAEKLAPESTLAKPPNCLGKPTHLSEAHAGNRKIDPEVLLNYRLAPDMLPFVRQIQIAADLAKGAAARLAGVEVPRHDDTEKTFADLKARLAKTVAFVQSFKPDDIDGSEDREIRLTLGEHTMNFKGQPYLVHFVMPNFYFHCTTAYDILRHCGVELGKRDFIGTI